LSNTTAFKWPTALFLNNVTTLPCETLGHNITAEQADGKCSIKQIFTIYIQTGPPDK